MDDLLDFLDEIGFGLQDRIRAIIRTKNKIATGRLEQSIDFAVGKEGTGKYFLRLLAADYAVFVNDGRKPGLKMPPKEPIEAWMKVKNIDVKYSYPIRVKIARDGIPAVKFFETAIAELERDFADDISKFTTEYSKELDKQFTNIFRSGFKTK
jgi:hypothetical protein